jgi:hypothetical protein
MTKPLFPFVEKAADLRYDWIIEQLSYSRRKRGHRGERNGKADEFRKH